MPLVILHHLLNVSVQLANKRGFKQKKLSARNVYRKLLNLIANKLKLKFSDKKMRMLAMLRIVTLQSCLTTHYQLQYRKTPDGVVVVPILKVSLCTLNTQLWAAGEWPSNLRAQLGVRG
jgi:hypothetical protein